jgi:pyridoxamine 5'-phosphate oxidase
MVADMLIMCVSLGSFRAPPPGQPVDRPYDDKNLELGKKIESNEDEVAFKNFRVVIILPDTVEATNLSDPSTARRQLYTFKPEDGSWTTEELWP